MSSLPLIKLGALIIKTVTKPIAKGIRNRAKDNPTFKKICIGTGNLKHKIIYNFNKVVRNNKKEYKQINESYAIEMGSEILSEMIIYTVGTGLIIGEYTYANIKKKKAELAKKKEEIQFKQRMANLEEIVIAHYTCGGSESNEKRIKENELLNTIQNDRISLLEERIKDMEDQLIAEQEKSSEV